MTVNGDICWRDRNPCQMTRSVSKKRGVGVTCAFSVGMSLVTCGPCRQQCAVKGAHLERVQKTEVQLLLRYKHAVGWVETGVI